MPGNTNQSDTVIKSKTSTPPVGFDVIVYLFLHLLLELIEPLLRAHIRHTFNHAVNIYFPYEVEIKQGQGCGIFVVLFLE